MVQSKLSIAKWILAIMMMVSLGGAYHEEVLIDFNETGGYKDNAEVKLQYLYNGNWKVNLNSSSDFIENRQLSYAANVPVNNTKEEKVFSEDGKTSGSVIGFRISFPKWEANAFGKAVPAYEVEAYAGDDGNMFSGKGLVKNVGTIKKLIALVKGKNFPHSFYIDLKDENDEVKSYFMGYLNFEGWNERVYVNPYYIENLRFREIYKIPLYPRVEPFLKLNSLTFFRHSDKIGGDFISYISWIKVHFDKAVIDDEDDIDDEKVWGILTKISREKANAEAARLKDRTELENLERKKMKLQDGAQLDPGDVEDGTTPPDDAGKAAAGGNAPAAAPAAPAAQ